MYWPDMNGEIKEYIQTCRELECSQTKETLKSHEVPDRPWQKVSVDLFSITKRITLSPVTIDHTFWEIRCLATTKSKAVITKLKAHFARMEIPGPQLVSDEFANFSRT